MQVLKELKKRYRIAVLFLILACSTCIVSAFAFFTDSAADSMKITVTGTDFDYLLSAAINQDTEVTVTSSDEEILLAINEENIDSRDLFRYTHITAKWTNGTDINRVTFQDINGNELSDVTYDESSKEITIPLANGTKIQNQSSVTHYIKVVLDQPNTENDTIYQDTLNFSVKSDISVVKDSWAETIGPVNLKLHTNLKYPVKLEVADASEHRTAYLIGDDFDSTNLVLKVTYNDDEIAYIKYFADEGVYKLDADANGIYERNLNIPAEFILTNIDDLTQNTVIKQVYPHASYIENEKEVTCDIPVTVGNVTMQSWNLNATTDFHAYKSIITDVEFMQEYNLPADFDTTAGYGPWDVSEAKDESVMAYMVGTKVYICANVGVAQNVIANNDSSYMFDNFSKLTSITNGENLDTRNVKNMSYMFSGCSSLISLDLSGWDTSAVTNMKNMFYSCAQLKTIYAGEGWNTDAVTSSANMFSGCTSLAGGYMHKYNSAYADKRYARIDTPDTPGYLTDQKYPIMQSWMVSRNATPTTDFHAYNDTVTEIEFMQEYNLPDDFDTTAGYGPWDISINKNEYVMAYMVDTKVYICANVGSPTKVIANENCKSTFHSFSKLTSIENGENLDTSLVKYMGGIAASQSVNSVIYGMFHGCTSLINIDGLATWDTSSVTDMSFMFNNCSSLTNVDGLANWDTSATTNMGAMFRNCSALTNVDGLANWDTNAVTMLSEFNDQYSHYEGMFFGCSSLSNVDGLTNWDTSAVKYMDYLFYNCSSLTDVDGLADWDTSAVTRMGNMFYGCTELTNIDGLADWDTGAATSIGGMFQGCSSLTNIDELADWDTGAVTHIGNMFYECSSLTNVDGLANWDVGSVTILGNMFYGCSKLVSIDLSNWELGTITYMPAVFKGCSSLTTIKGIANWNTSAAPGMAEMFSGCSSLTTIDLSGWDTGAVTSIHRMFNGCSSLTTIYVGNGWNLDKADSGTYMFYDCNVLVGGNGTVFNWLYPNKTYALIDAPGQSGYLTGPMYTVVFDANGGEGTMEKQKFNVGYSIALKSNAFKAPDGYKFAGWSTTADGSAMYTDNQEVKDLASAKGTITLYAVWESAAFKVTYDANGGKFSDGEASNDITYLGDGFSVTKISKTSNVKNDGSANETYSGNQSVTDVVTIAGAESLEVTITYATESTSYDWVCIYYGSVTPSSSNSSSSISGKLGGGGNTKTTKTFTIPGDTVQFYFKSDGSVHYYGYYATVTAYKDHSIFAGEYKEPTKDGYLFNGWYTDEDCTDGNEFDLKTATTSDTTVYAKWEEINPIMQSWTSSAKTDFHQYKSTITEVKLMQEYNLPDDFDTTAGYGPWDVSAAKDESVMAYMVDTKVYICANTGIPVDIIANADSSYMFYNFTKLTSITNGENLDTSTVTNMNQMLSACSSLANVDGLANWDTGKVTNMSSMLYGCSSLTKVDSLANWDTSAVTNIGGMFYNCSSLTNADGLADWDTGAVTNMSAMFLNCSSLTNVDGLANWDTNAVTNMRQMFKGCSKLTNIDGLAKWDTSAVTTMGYAESTYYYGMFADCSALTNVDALANWDTSAVTEMGAMFFNCSSLTNVDGLANWDISSVNTMNGLFRGCSSLSDIDGLANWDTSNVKIMGGKTSDSSSIYRDGVFYGCSSLTNVDALDNWDTSAVTNMSGLFGECSGLTNIDGIAGWDTSAVTNMKRLFYYCSSLPNVDALEDWDTGTVTNMEGMFLYCSKFTNVDGLANWNISAVTNMAQMFQYCSKLSNINGLAAWDTRNVTSMYNTFRNIYITNVDALVNWDTSNVTTMYEMFRDNDLITVDLSKWNTSSVTNMGYMFSGCHDLETISVGDGWVIDQVTNSSSMFSQCYKLVGGNGTAYNSSIIDKTYARVDKPGQPGYLTGPQCTVVFDANGGEGTMDNQKINVGYSAVLSSNIFTRPGFDFEGWSTTADGDVVYSNGQEVTDLAVAPGTITLYAKWKEIPGEIMQSWSSSATSDFHAYKSTITDVEFMLEYNLPNGFDTTAGYGPWDVSAAKDGGVMAYMIGTKVYICANGDMPVKVAANENSSYVFNEFTALENIDVTNLYTGFTNNMSYMFRLCSSLKTVDLSQFDVSSVTTFERMFSGCSALISVGDISDWNVTNATNYNYMFLNCTSLTSLDLSGWAQPTGNYHNYFVYGCTNLSTIYVGSKWLIWNTNNFGNGAWVYVAETIKYNANGGTGSMVDQYVEFGEATNLTTNTFTKEGYTFAGWATSATGEVIYQDGQLVDSLTAPDKKCIRTLYAVWTKDSVTLQLDINGGEVLK